MQSENEDGPVSTSTTTAGNSTTNMVEDAAAAAHRRTASMRQSRKTLEQCLRTFTEDMNRAGSAEEVEKYGGFCVKYARDLFKTLG